MLKMVDGTGIIGVDMICPLGDTTPQPPNYDRVELEGAGMLVLPNSLDAPLDRLELGGKTEQVTTRGVNLFDASLAKSKENYKDVTINGAIIRAIELDLKPNTKYAFQCVIRSVSTTMNVGNSTIRYVVSDGQKRVITTNEDGKLYVGFTGNVDSEIGKIGVSIVDIQVEEGDTQTAYEPYTGGKPSPSSEYPQEIKSVGKWNDEKQKYEIVMQVKGADAELQSLTLTSDRPFTKWDRLVEQGGQIGWLYKSRIAEIPKTGYVLKNTNENRYGVYFSKINIFKDAVVTKGSPEKDSNIFTHFKPGNPYLSNGTIAWLYVAGGNTDLRIKVEDETINTVELFEQYISDKDIKILYETAQTEFIPLPQSEQNAIRALKTYYPTTVITTDGGELDPDIKVTYRKEK